MIPHAIFEYFAYNGDIEKALDLTNTFDIREAKVNKVTTVLNYKTAIQDNEFLKAKDLISQHDPDLLPTNPNIHAWLLLAHIMHTVKNTNTPTAEILKIVRSDLMPIVSQCENDKEITEYLNKTMKSCIITNERGTFPPSMEEIRTKVWDCLWPVLQTKFDGQRIEDIVRILRKSMPQT